MSIVSPSWPAQALLRALATLLLICSLFAGVEAKAACTATGACLSAGPRLASVDTGQSALLNPLLGGLLGSQLSLTAADWNSLAQGDIKLLGFLNVLQTQLNLSSPSEVLNANLTLAQISAALGVQARAEARTSLAGVLGVLGSQLGNAGGTVRLGDLLKLSVDAGGLAKTTINSLDMLTGLIQLYNRRNVLTTPKPIGVSGGLPGALGVVNSLQLYAQVIEPAVYVCGPTGSTFHSAAIRVKLKLDLVTLAPVTDLLTALLGNTSIAIGQLDVYVEIARGEGTLKSVDAVRRAVTLSARPGVADIYIGKIDDGVFFNRSRRIDPAVDLGYGKIGSLSLAGLNLLDIEIKTWARGESPYPANVSMSGNLPQTQTVSTSSLFVTNLVDGLVSNLSLRIPLLDLGMLNLITDTVVGLVKTIVVGALSPILSPILGGIVDPLLQLLGIGLGQVVVTVDGICEVCDSFALVTKVDKALTLPGSTIVYTTTYTNTGSTTLNDLRIVSPTPPFTVFGAGACGTLAPGLSDCEVHSTPAVGAGGNVEWIFRGTLLPGASGTVTMDVLVQ